MPKTRVQIKKEFDEFAGKIARLESLRQQLNALDTKGFETDAKLIRAKLKDINAISQITRELIELRKKIEKKYKSSPVISAEKKKEHATLLKESASMKNKIKELQDLINKKRRISVKKQLSDKELKYVGDIPRLEGELRDLTEMFQKHTSSSKIKVDSGVGIIIDSKFDDFVLAVKGEISQKLREKEKLADNELEHDLDSQKKIFTDKYNMLAREFQEKYRQAVDTKLKEDVRREFNAKLKNRLDSERKKLIGALMRQNARRLAEERKKARKVLQEHYSEREKAFGKSINAQRKVIADRITALKTREKELVSKAKGHDEEIKRIKERYKKMEKEELARLGRFKRDEESEFKKRIASERKKLNDEERTLARKHSDIRKKLKEEEKALRKRYSEKQSALGTRGMALKERFASLIKREESDKEKEQRMRNDMGENRRKMGIELETAREKMMKNIKDMKKRHDNLIRERKQALEKKNQDDRAEFEKSMRERKMVIMKRIADAKDSERKASFVVEQKKKSLENERKELEARRESFRKEEEKKFAEMEKREKGKLNEEVRKVKEGLQKQYSEKVARISKEHDVDVRREVAVREREIRAEAEKEMKAMLDRERNRQEEKLRKKKQEIEKHIMEQAKTLFN